MLGGRKKLPDKDLLKTDGAADGAASLFDNVESDIKSEINK